MIKITHKETILPRKKGKEGLYTQNNACAGSWNIFGCSPGKN